MNCTGDATIPPQMIFRWTHNGSVAICYSVVFVIALFGNLLVLAVLIRNQCIKKRRVNTILFHMTIAQLLVTLVYIPKEIVHNLTIAWLGGDFLCRLCKFFDVFGVTLSAGILVCLSLDRFYSILFPLYVINAKRSVQWMLSIAWLVSFLSSIPQIYIFRTAQHPCFVHFIQCVSADVIGLVSPSIVYWFSVLNIVQPQANWAKLALLRGERKETFAGRRTSSLTATVMNGIRPKQQQNDRKKTKMKWGSEAGGSGLRRTGGTDSFEKAKNRTLRMTVVVVLCFLFCWTPYTVAMFIHFLRSAANERPISPLLSKFLYAFAVFNSAISPYLYFIFSFDPRKECHELAFHLLRYGGLRCFLGSNDTLNESVMSQTGRTTTGGGGAGRRQSGGNAIRTDSRRRAMIRRESRATEGMLTAATESANGLLRREQHQTVAKAQQQTATVRFQPCEKAQNFLEFDAHKFT
uniref:G-protein coupled receptors family 1 profile domain-containing protein n=1 Tax=Globodera rostochiensis TaxID=31243 RepID=A0A914I8C1_GLORO